MPKAIHQLKIQVDKTPDGASSQVAWAPFANVTFTAVQFCHLYLKVIQVGHDSVRYVLSISLGVCYFCMFTHNDA